MTFGLVEAESEATQSLMDLYAQAKKCQQLYQKAHMALPEPLQRFLGMSEQSEKAHTRQTQPTPARAVASIPPPARTGAPEGAKEDWISIKVSACSPSTVTLAILRHNRSAMRPRDVTFGVTRLLPDVLTGTIANVGTRLSADGVIERGERGWALNEPEKAGLLVDGSIWGPASIFTKQELAAHRRDAILHILWQFPSGLQTVQLVEQLANCSWVKAPVNKDLVKADMEVLSGSGKVRHRGNSKKWESVPGGQE